MTNSLNVQDSYKIYTVEEIQNFYKASADPAAVAAINVNGSLNIAMSIRSASLFGISNFYIIGRTKFDARATVGMDNYIPVHKIRVVEEGPEGHYTPASGIISALQDLTHIYTLVFIEQHHRSQKLTNLSNTNFNKPPLFVMGNEGLGIEPSIIDAFPESVIIEIPQKGVGRSHNVSNALSMVLWEYFRDKMT